MDTTESENSDIPQPVEKRKKQKAPWRTIVLEDGTTKYNSKPNDPLYFRKYYLDKRRDHEGAIVACERCQRELTLGHMNRHQKSNYCIKRYNEKQVQLLS